MGCSDADMSPIDVYKVMLKDERREFEKIIQIIGQADMKNTLVMPSDGLNKLRSTVAEEMIIEMSKKLN